MAYKHSVHTHKKGKQARRFRVVALSLVALAGLFCAYVAYDWYSQSNSTSDTVVTNEVVSSVQSAKISVYRSPYFQFQAPDSWVAVADQSRDDVYTYVKNHKSLVQERLVVYVDRSDIERESDQKITHVLPVEIGQNGAFENVGQVSSHCDGSWPDGLKRNPSRIVHEDVSFVCSIGSKQYNVVFGERGDDENMTVTLRDGSEVTLTVVFSNLTAYPSPGDVYSIARSFSIL